MWKQLDRPREQCSTAKGVQEDPEPTGKVRRMKGGVGGTAIGTSFSGHARALRWRGASCVDYRGRCKLPQLYWTPEEGNANQHKGFCEQALSAAPVTSGVAAAEDAATKYHPLPPHF